MDNNHINTLYVQWMVGNPKYLIDFQTDYEVNGKEQEISSHIAHTLVKLWSLALDMILTHFRLSYVIFPWPFSDQNL